VRTGGTDRQCDKKNASMVAQKTGSGSKKSSTLFEKRGGGEPQKFTHKNHVLVKDAGVFRSYHRLEKYQERVAAAGR